MKDLITRLENADGPSRELDLAIALAVGIDAKDGARVFADRPHPVEKDAMGWIPLRHFTSSIDAAITLVPEGAEWNATNIYGIARTEVGLNFNDYGPFYGERKDGNIAIALCIAALKARGAENE